MWFPSFWLPTTLTNILMKTIFFYSYEVLDSPPHEWWGEGISGRQEICLRVSTATNSFHKYDIHGLFVFKTPNINLSAVIKKEILFFLFCWNLFYNFWSVGLSFRLKKTYSNFKFALKEFAIFRFILCLYLYLIRISFI